MTSPDAPMVKVILRSPEGDEETLWAFDLGQGRYRLDNSPWYADGISWQDVVQGTANAHGKIEVERVIEKSGNRTIRIVSDQAFSKDLLAQLTQRGVSFEGVGSRYLSLNIPPSGDLVQVVNFLTSSDVRWEYADPTWEQMHGDARPT